MKPCPDRPPRDPWRRPRTLLRFGGFLMIAGGALADFGWRRLRHGSVPPADRAQWLHAWARRMARVINLQIQVSGTAPERGLLVSNHLSYLDIVVLGACGPTRFVSKSEVRRWPLLGILAACGGTFFVDRSRRKDVLTVGAALQTALRDPVVIALFPEGTSSDGRQVLPFYPSLLEPAVAGNLGVRAAAVRYSLVHEDGSVEEEICYWRDMTFLPHFLNLLSKRRIRAEVRFGPSQFQASHRAELSDALHREVSRLLLGPGAAAPSHTATETGAG